MQARSEPRSSYHPKTRPPSARPGLQTVFLDVERQGTLVFFQPVHFFLLLGAVISRGHGRMGRGRPPHPSRRIRFGFGCRRAFLTRAPKPRPFCHAGASLVPHSRPQGARQHRAAAVAVAVRHPREPRRQGGRFGPAAVVAAASRAGAAEEGVAAGERPQGRS